MKKKIDFTLHPLDDLSRGLIKNIMYIMSLNIHPFLKFMYIQIDLNICRISNIFLASKLAILKDWHTCIGVV